MRAYLELAWAEFRRYSGYRLAVLAGVFTNSVFGYIRVSVLWAAIAVAGGSLAGYSIKEASTYVWLGQAFLAPVEMGPWTDVADRVTTGEVAVDLSRPVDLQLGWWVRDLGRAAFVLPARGLPPLLVGALTVGIAFPGSWTAYPLGLLSLAVGVSISFQMRFLVNLIAFWTTDVRGLSPFPSMFQAPIDVMSGRVLGEPALQVIAVQLGWLAGLVLLGRVVLSRATRRLVVQGG